MRDSRSTRAVILAALAGCLLGAGTAAATPAHCANFIYARNVRVVGTSCRDADHAFAKGTFSGPTNNTFRTPGWSCSRTGTRPNAHFTCKRKKAVLRFTA